MHIREYLYTNRVQVKELAIQCGLQNQVISNIKCGNISPSFKTCKKIVEATNYHVGYADLMPDVYDAMVKEYKAKITEVKNGY